MSSIGFGATLWRSTKRSSSKKHQRERSKCCNSETKSVSVGDRDANRHQTGEELHLAPMGVLNLSAASRERFLQARPTPERRSTAPHRGACVERARSRVTGVLGAVHLATVPVARCRHRFPNPGDKIGGVVGHGGAFFLFLLIFMMSVSSSSS